MLKRSRECCRNYAVGGKKHESKVGNIDIAFNVQAKLKHFYSRIC